MLFNIVFHVHDNDHAGAQEWLDRANKILLAHADQLISATREVDKTKAGAFCSGHVVDFAGSLSTSDRDRNHSSSSALGASSTVPTPRA